MRELFQRKTGGVWWCEYYNSTNRRVRRSTRCKDRRAAELKRRQYEREAHDPNRAAADPATPPVSSVLEHFVNHGCPAVAEATLSMYVQKSGHLQRLVGERPAGDLQDISVMQGYIKTRLEEGAKPGTVYKELVTMRQALYAALEAKHIHFDPRICFPRFRGKYVPKERWLTPDEAYRLLLAFKESPARQMWIVVALYTGARDSEVDGLRWEDIDWRTKMIRIRGTKTDGAPRDLPLQPVLAAVLLRSRQATGLIVRMTFGLGWRRAEVARAALEDIDGDTISATVKGSKRITVGLPDFLAEEIFEWRQFAEIQDGAIFPRRAHDRRAINGAIVYRVVRQMCERAGIDVVPPHALRRTNITHAGIRNVSLKERQLAVGHSSSSTTERYDRARNAAGTKVGNVFADLVRA